MKTVLTLIIVTILAIPGCRRGRVKQHGTNVNMETVVRTNSDNSYRGIPVRIGPNRWENCSESDDIEKLEYWYKDGKVCANEYLVGSEELYEVFIKRSRQRNHSYWSAFAQGYKDGKQEIRQKQLEEEKIEQEIAQKAKIEEENNRLKNYGKTTEY